MQFIARKKNKVWLTKDEVRPLVSHTTMNSHKTIFVIFFDRHGLLLKVPVKHVQHVNANFYKSSCLQPLIDKIKSNCLWDGLFKQILHHDNATSHKAACATEFLQSENVEIMEHPPYSPDLSLTYFWLFGYLTNTLAEKHLTEVKELSSAIYQAFARYLMTSGLVHLIVGLIKCNDV